MPIMLTSIINWTGSRRNDVPLPPCPPCHAAKQVLSIGLWNTSNFSSKKKEKSKYSVLIDGGKCVFV